MSTMQNTHRSARVWMIIAFIAGMVFTAVLAQTLFDTGIFSSGSDFLPAAPDNGDTLKPDMVPEQGYLVEYNINRLVYASATEANIYKLNILPA